MTFPVIAGTQKSVNAASVTAHVITLPASVAAGDLIIAWCFQDGSAGGNSWPGSWVELDDAVIGASVANATVGYLIASGGETSVTVTSVNAERSSHIAARITGWHGTTAPEEATPATGAGTTPNPPTLNPAGWDVEDTLWIAWYGVDTGAATAYPLPDNNLTTSATDVTSAAYGAICSDELAQASLDPGTFTTSLSDDWRAGTIAVRPTAGGAAADLLRRPSMAQLLAH